MLPPQRRHLPGMHLILRAAAQVSRAARPHTSFALPFTSSCRCCPHPRAPSSPPPHLSPKGSLVLYHFLIANAIHYILVYTWDSEHVAGMPANLIRYRAHLPLSRPVPKVSRAELTRAVPCCP